MTRLVSGASLGVVELGTDSTAPAPGMRSFDAESQGWLDALGAGGTVGAAALERLHSLLLRAARFEINRRRGVLPHVRGDDFDDLAHQSADDALVAILGKLGDFRGDSRFTTWAYKFALFEAATALRRRAWQGRELPLPDEGWEVLVAPTESPPARSENGEILRALQQAIATDLTPHQREVLVTTTLNGVPIDVLAERLNTTRGALYKTLHDARRKLRASLTKAGLELPGGPDA
jgi:RNA polymerase sigma-70 factor (ECF subfamily)